jgi:type IV pilus assembly protein PilM
LTVDTSVPAEPAAQPVELPPPAAPPAPEPDPELPPAPEPVLAPAAAVVPEPAVELPVAPIQEVHPPVPSAELPPLAEEETKPFWKRDLGKPKADKKPKAEKPKREKQPKAEKPKRAPRVKREKKSRGHNPKKLVGLKIGASQIAAARVSNNGSIELQSVARETLPDGIVVGGELRNPDALAAALKDFFKKHKLPRKGIRLGIANNRIGVRAFDIVGIDDPKQLTNAIHFRAQEALPIPIDEAVLDYQVLSEHTDEDGVTTRKILLVVAYRELIDRYVSACRKAGLTLAGIDLEAFALLRALAPPQDGTAANSGAALVAVSVGHERSTFAVSDGRVCDFTRVLEWGGSALSVAIARVLDLTPSEAEPVKRQLSLVEAFPIDGLTDEQLVACREAVQKQIQSFARELVSSLQFYQNQPGSLGIGEIVLTGGTAHLPGLADELQRLIGVSVRVGDPLARVRVNKRMADPEQVGSLAVAIGLAIED